MKKFILLALGFSVACLAAYCAPKDFKTWPDRHLLKEIHIFQVDLDQVTITNAVVAEAVIQDGNFSPGGMQLLYSVKPSTLKIENRFAVTNLKYPRYLARYRLSAHDQNTLLSRQLRW